MSVDKIIMSAIPAVPEDNALPKSLKFDPSVSKPIHEPANTTVQFVADQSLLNYVENDNYKVTLIWQGKKTPVTVGEVLEFNVGPSGSKDQFELVVSLSTPSITDTGDDAISTNGEIVVD